MVDEILEGFSIRGLNFSTGFYDNLPSLSELEREEMDLELERSLHHGPSEVLRLLERGSPGDGQQHVLDHTHKEHSNGKFEPHPDMEQWQIYKDVHGNVVSNVPYDRYLPTLRFPCAQLGKDNTSWGFRPIDDCSASDLNGSTHTSEHLRMHGLGTFLSCAHMVRKLFSSWGTDGEPVFESQSGRTMR